MRLTLPPLLSLNAGYVDTAGFLALQGLFTAHVTGNFVTIGAALVFGTSGVIAKLAALPVFCLFVALTRLASRGLSGRELPALRTLLAVKLLLLILGAALAVHFGPFIDGDAWVALATGMVLVSAMAIQNAVQRIHLAGAPPTTLMTGSTTQIMIDGADLLAGLPPDKRPAVKARLLRTATSIGAFALGCAAAALAYAAVNVWCFVVPPVLALLALTLRIAEYEKPA
ncbi:MAG: hypothetical protein JWO51_5109 [Rhodospirillales bacterium]|nr:hypothetical protein [Rhodospirillales bacterium]